MRIVFAAPLYPLPPDGGAKIRLLRHLEVLSQRHDVTLITVPRTHQEWESADELKKYGELICVKAPHRKSPLHRIAYRLMYTAMAAGRSWPMDAFYGCPGIFSQTVKQEALRQTADIVHYDFWFAALGDLSAQPYRRVMLEHDIEYIRRRRDYERASFSETARLKARWLTTERAECQVLRSVDTVLTVTDGDSQEALAAGAHQAITLPTGIDTDTHKPPATEPVEPRLVYVGAYSHHPNVDAMLWFVHDILPLIRREHPDVLLDIVGSAPPAEILALGNVPGVRVTGAVPDVAPYIQNAQIAIAPLRVGSGIKGKIIEAMAYGRPVVTTSIGAEGMGLENNHNVVLAESAADFGLAVSDLLSNPGKARAVGNAGRALVEERHSQSKADQRLIEIYEVDIWKGKSWVD